MNTNRVGFNGPNEPFPEPSLKLFEVLMRKLIFILLFAPICTFSLGCGKSETTVVEPTPEAEAEIAAEAETAEEELETGADE